MKKFSSIFVIVQTILPLGGAIDTYTQLQSFKTKDALLLEKLEENKFDTSVAPRTVNQTIVAPTTNDPN